MQTTDGEARQLFTRREMIKGKIQWLIPPSFTFQDERGGISSSSNVSVLDPPNLSPISTFVRTFKRPFIGPYRQQQAHLT